jgi:two-component system cell cycle response regulator DivK
MRCAGGDTAVAIHDPTEGFNGMKENDANRPKIMIVEDFDDVRMLLKSLLEQSGYRVVEVVNGQEAIDTARRERPDLILMDLSLPVLDGFGAIYHIRKQAGLSNVPIVIISSHTSPEVRADALAAGCSEYLPKPFDSRQLKNTIDRILSKD